MHLFDLYQLSEKLACRNMRLTTLVDVYNILRTGKGEIIELDPELSEKAKKPIEKMIELNLK